jgi:polysaccharide deacetylase 2 family uncharacterized protein YibQ
MKGTGRAKGLKQRKRNKNLSIKERFAALLIGSLAVLLFFAGLLVYNKLNGGGQRPTVTEKPPAVESPLPLPPPAAPAPVAKAPPLPPVVSPPPPARAKPLSPPEKASAGIVAAAPPERPVPPRPERKGVLVCVIDDAGNNLRELPPFLRFPGALTIAVLPGLPHSAEAASMVRKAGKELFLHQPMEALGGADPGPGAIYMGMSAAEVRAILEKNVRETGPIAGINNHQGSLVTQDEEIMRVVLDFCRENGLIFLDSRTTADTAVPKIAQDAGIRIAERNIFVDNEQDRLSMERALQQGIVVAREKRSAVMIGHTWSPELAAMLADSYAALGAEGYEFLTVSQMIEGSGR